MSAEETALRTGARDGALVSPQNYFGEAPTCTVLAFGLGFLWKLSEMRLDGQGPVPEGERRATLMLSAPTWKKGQLRTQKTAAHEPDPESAIPDLGRAASRPMRK